MDTDTVVLRPAIVADAGDIARVMRAALDSFEWMPILHTPAEDLAFIASRVLPERHVTVAEAAGAIVGFVSVHGEWVEQLYLDPSWTGQGIGSRLLRSATAGLPTVRLYCFQLNAGARRFYERQNFVAAEFRDGKGNEEGLPDILYIRRN